MESKPDKAKCSERKRRSTLVFLWTLLNLNVWLLSMEEMRSEGLLMDSTTRLLEISPQTPGPRPQRSRSVSPFCWQTWTFPELLKVTETLNYNRIQSPHAVRSRFLSSFLIKGLLWRRDKLEGTWKKKS